MRDFHDDLEQRFFGLCGYCEWIDKGEVDHFRPKSRFPESVYDWSNWIFACHDCNQANHDKWPAGGYVDPCATDESCRPELYFTFDTQTCEILAVKGLDPGRFDKARRMIDDLRLNGLHHLRKRRVWILAVAQAIPDDPIREAPDTEVYRHNLASRATQLSSVARAWLVERGYSISD